MSDVAQPYPMVYTRTAGAETYVIALNPSAKRVETTIRHLGKAERAMLSGKAAYKSGAANDKIQLGPESAAVYRIKL